MEDSLFQRRETKVAQVTLDLPKGVGGGRYSHYRRTKTAQTESYLSVTLSVRSSPAAFGSRRGFYCSVPSDGAVNPLVISSGGSSMSRHAAHGACGTPQADPELWAHGAFMAPTCFRGAKDILWSAMVLHVAHVCRMSKGRWEERCSASLPCLRGSRVSSCVASLRILLDGH